MDKILITYNEDDEMMFITKNDEYVFSGNYWDFERDPDSLGEFLTKLGLNVQVQPINNGE